MKALRIAVIGCGPAGQSAALFLAKSGHRVEVFEKVPKLGPVGAGFLPTAFVALKKLGLFDEINSLGSRVDLLYGRTNGGRTVLELPYTEIDSTFEKEMRRLNIPIHLDADVDSLELNGRVSIKTKKSSQTREDFDLAVVAEGARSRLRAKHFKDFVTRDSEYGWGTLYAMVDDDDNFFSDMNILHQIFEGTKKMMGLMPSGHATESGQRSEKKKVTLFWSLHKDNYPHWANGESLDDWKKRVVDHHPFAARIVSKIQSKDQLPFATYCDVRMSQYHNSESNAVIIGDAAHAMYPICHLAELSIPLIEILTRSPVLGQGINFALLDAMTLTEALKTHSSLPEALSAYSKTRKQALRFYQFVSRSINPWFQSSNFPGVSLTRDLFFNPFTHLPLIRKQLLLTQIGAKSGLFPLHKLDETIQWRHWEL